MKRRVRTTMKMTMHLPCLLNLLLLAPRKSLGRLFHRLSLGLPMTMTTTMTTLDRDHYHKGLSSRRRMACKSSWRGKNDAGNI